MLDIDKIRAELGQYVLDAKECFYYNAGTVIERWAIEHWGRLPYLRQFSDKRLLELLELSHSSNIDCPDVESLIKKQNIDMDKTIKNILEAYPDTITYYYKTDKLSNAILFNEKFVYNNGVFYMDVPEMPQKMFDCIVNKQEKTQIEWVVRNGRGFIETKPMEIYPKGSIEDNYNDDFKPIDEKIQTILRDDESSIMILHGKPGTGKTSYIRNLIANNKDIKFYWVDSSMFNYIDTSEFIEFIADCKNAVFVLEDSEILLTSREESCNPAMQSLLSISDGMLGDSLKLKFICTFNTDLTNIDTAIQRKGRMKIKYEFKDLCSDKVKKIFKKMGVDESLAKNMPLCDVYNYLDDNGYKDNKTNRTQIGF